MKTFKEYRSAKNVISTCFGSHSGMSPDKSIVISDEDLSESTLEEHHTAFHETLKPTDITSDEEDAIRSYTSSSSGINSYMHGEYHKQFNITDHSKKVGLISSALRKNPTKGAFTVYTGVKDSPAKYFKPGQLETDVHNPTFTSTSSKRSVAAMFSSGVSHPSDSNSGVAGVAHHIIKIRVPSGAQATSVRHLATLKSENEVLINPANYRIKNNPQILGHTGAGHPVYQWDAELTGH